MSWRYRRREERQTQQDADLLDEALGDEGAASAARFSAELAAARMVASSITPSVEPPPSARVALRAGLAMRRVRSRPPIRRAAIGLASMAAAALVALVLVTSLGGRGPTTVVAAAQHSLDQLNLSVRSLQDAIGSGDRVLIDQRAADARAAAQVAQVQASGLSEPSRGIALRAANQQTADIEWLLSLNHGQVATASASTTPSTSRAAATSTSGRPSTTKPGGATTSSSTSTPSTTSEPSTTSTTAAPTTSTTAPPSSSTTAPPSTTQAPTTTTPPGGGQTGRTPPRW
ncbi:MAG: hypothetical protein ACYDH6_10105 [Acidimicrobiales bacterium]